jgi:ankyrin repeat protein
MRTPMHYAAAAGNLEIVKTLQAAGANIHAVDIRGSTPLHDAAAAGHRKVYIYLLELDASDTTRDNDGKTPAELFTNQ